MSSEFERDKLLLFSSDFGETGVCGRGGIGGDFGLISLGKGGVGWLRGQEFISLVGDRGGESDSLRLGGLGGGTAPPLVDCVVALPLTTTCCVVDA